jgi:hypothetical protein
MFRGLSQAGRKDQPAKLLNIASSLSFINYKAARHTQVFGCDEGHTGMDTP